MLVYVSKETIWQTRLLEKSVTWIFVAPNDEPAEALKIFFDGHLDIMKEKCEKEGNKKLILYYVSEAPELSHEKDEFAKWFSSKYPKKDW